MENASEAAAAVGFITLVLGDQQDDGLRTGAACNKQSGLGRSRNPRRRGLGGSN